jgi:hypothetical protein
MGAAEIHLDGRKNEFFYLVEIEKQYFEPWKRLVYKVTYSDGFGEWFRHYYLGENIPTIIEL